MCCAMELSMLVISATRLRSLKLMYAHWGSSVELHRHTIASQSHARESERLRSGVKTT